MQIALPAEGHVLVDTDSESVSDEALLAGYATGDKPSFNIFFSRHWKRVRAYGLAKGLSSESADDLVQNCFEKLHQSVTRYDASKGGALRWFFSMVHNACTDLHRERGAESRRREHLAIDREMHPDEGSSMKDFPDLSQTLSTLSEMERNLIQWRFQDELSFAEIGARTGVSEVRLRKQWSRLAKKIRGLANHERGPT